MRFNEMQLHASCSYSALPPTIKGSFAAERALTISPNSLKTWWPGRELNPRRQPFQGCALPPELPGHVSKPALRVAGCEDCSLHAGCGRDGCNRSDAESVRNVFDYSNGEGFPQRALRVGLRLSPKSVHHRGTLINL